MQLSQLMDGHHLGMPWKYLGGDKRSNGRFSYMDGPYFKIGLRHRPMTGINRERFFNRSRERRHY